MAMTRDYYEVLGVGRDAPDADIKRSFRRLARELHPDVNRDDPEAAEKFKAAAEAYEVLSDPQRRATYDRYGHDGLRSGGYSPNFDSFGSFGDIFEAFFGGGGFGGARRGPAQGGDVAVEVDVDLATAARGSSEEIEYDAVVTCERCRGNGAEPGTPIETCPTCGGAGQVRAVSRTPFGQMVRAATCEACGGDGRVAREPCTVCDGRGRTVARRTLRVDVPAGIEDGQRIRLAGRGHAGEAGASPGDLYVLVRVREDERFLRDGDDLVTVIDVPAPLAALGATLRVPTLEGDADLDVPAGTQPGATLLLRGQGMPSLRSRRRGDLRAIVDVVIPRRLSAEQRDLLERLAGSLTDENLGGDGDGGGIVAKLRRLFRA